MIQSDLRAFLAEVEKGGELKTVTGAHWDKEMGAVTEPGKFADWIAPPGKGIYGQPLDFDYVRFN